MKKKKRNNLRQKSGINAGEVHVYDNHDTTVYIDPKRKMKLNDLGFELPKDAPTKVLSLRVPTALLNSIKAYAGEHDVPYSAMIKMLLVEGIELKLKRRRVSAG